MNAIALIAAMLVGQCGPNGCPKQQIGSPINYQQLLQASPFGSCGPDGCGRFQGVQLQSTFRWVPVPNCDQFALYAGNTQIGGYDYSIGVYRPYYSNAHWGEPTPAPVAPPATPETTQKAEVKKTSLDVTGCTIDENGVQNFGVQPDPNEKPTTTPRYEVNGKPASKHEVLQAFESKAGDQSTKLRLTVIGPRQSRQVVLEDLKRTLDLQGVLKDFLLKDYDPEDWEVSRSGFYTKGQPTIYVQAPSGKVLHRQDSYTGPDELAAVLRKANDQYKPEADPNLSKAAVFGLFGIPVEAWIVIAIVLWFVIPRKENNS